MIIWGFICPFKFRLLGQGFDPLNPLPLCYNKNNRETGPKSITFLIILILLELEFKNSSLDFGSDCQ